MSNTEIASPQVYSAIKVANNGFLIAAATPNFNGSSELLSIVRLNVNPTIGDVGVPHAVVVPPSSQVANDWLLGIATTSLTDDSSYQINWVNKEYSSNYLVPGVINGVVQPFVNSPQYYSP